MRIQSNQCVAARVATVTFLILFVSPQPVAAQSLFETLFGFLGTQSKPAQPSGISRNNPFADGMPGPTSYGGRYRTVCVRLCDGYFFPISNASSRHDFYDDARQCRSRCQSETRLYYMSPMRPAIEQARDQRGLSYRDLKTAFLYRKKLVKSCTCRPAPWTAAERQRHKSYETAEPDAIANLDSSQTIAARTAVDTPQPGMFAANDNPSSVAIASAYPPRAVPGSFVQQQRLRARPNQRHQPEENQGLGYTLGLPKVRYRHNWSTE